MLQPKEILVIKHGALGDIVLATGAFAAIREKHIFDQITVLTTPPYAALLNDSPFFDNVWTDVRPKWWQFDEWLRLLRLFRSKPFAMVYDLQCSTRTSVYYKLFPNPKPLWSGSAKGASHHHSSEERRNIHTIERQRMQLERAGVTGLPPTDLSWLEADLSVFLLKKPYVLLVPGGSAHRTEKRWPAEGYIDVAEALLQRGVQPVLIGSRAESGLLEQIVTACPMALNLCDQTTFADIAELARNARAAVGNDTGPMHLIAGAGCPSVVLFSKASNPALCAPRGPKVFVMGKPELKDLSSSEVIGALSELLPA